MNLFDVKNKVVIVTGAGRGIGRSIAKGFAKEGAKVVVCSRTKAELTVLKNEIKADGGICEVVTCDVGIRSDIERVIKTTVDTFGKLDVLINNAGMTKKVPAIDLTMEDFKQVIDVNLTGVFSFAQLAGRVMIKQGFGKIINISSIASVQGLKGSVAYAASKGGVKLITETLAIEWAEHGVQVNAIAPAYVETPLMEALKTSRVGFEEAVIQRTPMGRMAKPDEMIGACIFLASEASSYITGETIFLDGGWKAYGL
ncbi:SDR family NAD(P)-dependent oxidoreductase [Sporosarcina sp. P13]|uniref:SDR family NAD(P)-dependent oxidoreductase n=1 Tax=Sporosarcina sp. P13 TaxID=2048263 RepID=UPI0013043D9B|nr:glucose 1-dehydrogenase [Sporosarcina sp. P13]